MNKILVSSLVAVVALGANIASAQSYYPSYPTYGTTYPTYQTYQQPYTGACVNLTSDLSYGSRGSQVLQLQTFLVSRNYPGGGNWMITGYFGPATRAAVRNFQMEQGISMVGVVGPVTRAAIARVTCGGYNYNTVTLSSLSPFSGAVGTSVTIYGSNFDYSNNTVYFGTQPVTNIPSYNGTSLTVTVPWSLNQSSVGVYVTNSRGTSNTLTFSITGNTCQYPYTNCNTNVNLQYLSPVSGAAGTSVTIYGTGFDYSSNTVYVGNQAVTNVSSYNGTSLTATIPSYLTGVVQIYVTNSRGTSNSLPFTITGTTCVYPYTNCYGTPNIQYLSPVSGAVGSTVTIYGSGFSQTGNTVRFGTSIVSTNVSSYDGRTLTFIVPSYLSGYPSQVVTPGSYNVSISNSMGQTSNSVPFTVTSGTSGGALQITNVSGPNTLAIGSVGTWSVTVSAPSYTYTTLSVRWGDEVYYYTAAAPQSQYIQGTQTFTFTHTYNQAGTYTVTFTASNAQGQQNTATASVVVSGGTTGTVTLSSLSPMWGRVGNQIVLQGSGFSSYDNVVHFGIGGQRNVPSYNGTTIYYTIPYSVSVCDIVGPGCLGGFTQPVTPGSYPIYVTNSQGTSQTLQFQVIQ
ncbi:hypothetical protein A2704_05400 [Candidatus Kaiserbacteria bacterium RIFCSPHIGHO2_01_FULL_54_36b]|uniref:PKD domain-containing protein n=1 Tax=Candidatus Kaiserbacteria bacterium RIFCSPHIGHO2_01_FULL_54_36b TaxID=1798483 RepID=A0A1F6CMT0_9BACT|nr:MAG: hypothetical protein A2704_05400 [Candidatus Kaiserbacteria bacterium RIFCSPHIGHO2_01_FULL_54_36b]